jgi:hypothetical protein
VRQDHVKLMQKMPGVFDIGSKEKRLRRGKRMWRIAGATSALGSGAKTWIRGTRQGRWKLLGPLEHVTRRKPRRLPPTYEEFHTFPVRNGKGKRPSRARFVVAGKAFWLVRSMCFGVVFFCIRVGGIRENQAA